MNPTVSGPLIAPSILSCDFARLAEEIADVEAGGADWIHVDVMDGHFVPNLTMGPVIVAGARRCTALPLDVHLMIENPEAYLRSFADAGADAITVHAEVCDNLAAVLKTLDELEVEAGVAVNPETPLSAVEGVLDGIDLLVVMSVNPGFGGQGYIPGSADKVRRASELIARMNGDTLIEVDGGVDASNAARIAEAGATVLVAGSAVFGHPEGGSAGVREIRRALTRSFA